MSLPEGLQTVYRSVLRALSRQLHIMEKKPIHPEDLGPLKSPWIKFLQNVQGRLDQQVKFEGLDRARQMVDLCANEKVQFLLRNP